MRPGFETLAASRGYATGAVGVWTALGASIDRDMAVVAALALRLSWVVGELLAALARDAPTTDRVLTAVDQARAAARARVWRLAEQRAPDHEVSVARPGQAFALVMDTRPCAGAERLARGPAFALAVTKEMLERELDVTLDTALELEAQAQAVCMQHPDYGEAYRAFTEKREPRFGGARADEG